MRFVMPVVPTTIHPAVSLHQSVDSLNKNTFGAPSTPSAPAENMASEFSKMFVKEAAKNYPEKRITSLLRSAETAATKKLTSIKPEEVSPSSLVKDQNIMAVSVIDFNFEATIAKNISDGINKLTNLS